MRLLLILLALLVGGAAWAQHMQPYAGQQKREIKALSEEDVAGYLGGAGMGYAKAAELNGYPGPMHVLELGDRLGLTDEQKAAMRKLLDAHKADARAIGAKYVQSEREIEMLFRHGAAEQAKLAALVHQSATLQGQYRVSHLETHRQALALLTPDQITTYAKLRGYVTGDH